ADRERAGRGVLGDRRVAGPGRPDRPAAVGARQGAGRRAGLGRGTGLPRAGGAAELGPFAAVGRPRRRRWRRPGTTYPSWGRRLLELRVPTDDELLERVLTLDDPAGWREGLDGVLDGLADVGAFLRRLRAEAERHWAIDPRVSLRCADALIHSARRLGDA